MGTASFSTAAAGRDRKFSGWSRTRISASAVLLLLASGCSEVAVNGMSKAAMEIHLETTAGPGLRAALRNTSGSEQAVLHSQRVQPSRVVLTGEDGKELAPFDERTRRKFDRTVRPAMFTRLAPGAELEFGAQQFRKISDRLYELRWGPYTYRQIPAGEWKATVVFDCRIDKPSDGSTISNAWSGNLKSNTVTVRLD